MMSRAVARGHARKAARPITYIGVDEKAFRKGHRYHTIVCDLQRATVEFVAEDRKTESLAADYAQLTDAQRRALHAVAMDMWEAYIGATRDGLPDGAEKIGFDRFHIMREMTKAVDTVRKQEHRAFRRAGADSPLTGTKYLWLFSDERRPARHAAAFATLQALNLKVGRAWAIKEALRALWTYRHQAAVKRFFTRWYGWAIRSRLAPVKQVAKTLKRHLAGVLRFVTHPITNGVAEGPQQQDHEHQAKGRRLPQPVTLHDGDLFSPVEGSTSTHAKPGRTQNNWVVISTVQGQFEEGQLRAFLGAYDIPTQVRGEALRTTHGLSVDGLGAVEILVQATDADAARDLIAKAERGELTVPDSDVTPTEVARAPQQPSRRGGGGE